MTKLLFGVACALLVSSTFAADAAAWKKRTVYQLLTDRFARGSGDKSNC